ncbi:Ig-like domain-containing protein [Hymenobacter daeguensis]
MPFSAFSQCANQITVDYYNNGTFTSQTVNNGQSGFTAGVCPVAGAQYTLNGSSSSNAVLTWSRVITMGNTPANDVVQDISSISAVTGTVLSVSPSFTVSTIYRLKSDANAYGGCNKVGYVYLTLTPSLTLSSPGATGVCAGTSTTLTAAGASSGGYTWSANGTNIPTQTGSTLTVSPTVTTTYTVTATTSCGVSSQQITIPVFAVSIAPSAPVVCAGQATTLTATYTGTLNSIGYYWYVKDQPALLSTARTITVAPTTTTTYQLNVLTNDCNLLTKEITVTVGAPTVGVASSAATICSGGSTTLTAVSNNPNATYSWSPATGLSATTGATVTASPAVATTYTVTATTPCGTPSTPVTVSVAGTATYAVTPSAAALCAGNSTTLVASSNISEATYRWFKSTDLGTVISTAAALNVAPAANTTYRVLTNTSCGNNSQDVAVTVSSNPVAVTPASTTQNYGGTTTLTASGGTSYVWKATQNNTTTTLPYTTASISVSPSYTTMYTATATNIPAGCNTAQATVGVSRPLPVELIRFEAAWTEGSPLLSWTTASEKHSAYFGIERSLDGRNFAEIGQRTSAGSTSERSDYYYSDLSLSSTSSMVYYRLRQVDADGTTSYSPVRSVLATAGANAFSASVFPNPFAHTATVLLRAPGPDAIRLTIVNVLGQTVLTKTVAPTAGVQEIVLPQADALPVGLYYLTIGQGSRQQVLRLSHR